MDPEDFFRIPFESITLMDPPGFEPGAPGVQDRCSTRLSYRPNDLHDVLMHFCIAWY